MHAHKLARTGLLSIKITARSVFVSSDYFTEDISALSGVSVDKREEKFFKKFGEIVRKERHARNWTLEDMSDHGFSPAHFQKIESGKKAISLFTAQRIAKAFAVSLQALVKSL